MAFQKRVIAGTTCPRCADVDEHRIRTELAPFPHR